MTDVAICVPRRADNGHRDRLWEFARKRWEHDFPDWPIFEGNSNDGPFNRAQALNRAVAAAGERDVYLLIDSDVLANQRAVANAVALAHSSGQLVVSHDERIMLTKAGTEKVLSGYTGSWRTSGMVERIWPDSVSCSVAVSRTLWETVGGFDELFVGWGREDTAFRIACETLTDKPMLRGSSELFHLWHPVTPEAKQSSPIRQANEKRHQRYVAARWNPDAVRALLDEAATSGLDLPPTTIPRIFHRTVPAETTDEVEGWWADLRRMHPGWQFRTYREPIDPADFPVSSPVWSKCQNGAQKAGLIRLEALVRDGGVYVDSDVRPVNSFEPLLALEAFAGWEDETTVPDAVLGARPGHPAFVEMLDRAVKAVRSRADAWQSGPGITTAVLPGRSDVLCMPPGAFYDVHYLQKHKLDEPTGPWTFARHYWHHSWGTPSQKAAIERAQRQ